MDYVAGHEGGGIVVALQRARGQVPLDLQPEEVAGVLLLDLRRRVRRVKLDAEPEEGVARGEAHLVVHLLVQVQPILKGGKKTNAPIDDSNKCTLNYVISLKE